MRQLADGPVSIDLDLLEHSLVRSEIVPSRNTHMWNIYEIEICGLEGVIVSYEGVEPPVYAFSFCPDEDDGEGEIFFLMSSSFPEDVSYEVFDSVGVDL